MIEDKLDHDERLRLECLAQAIARNAPRSNDRSVVVRDAKAFEQYVTTGEVPE